MIVGNGLLATEFMKSEEKYDNVIIFASGVSNSKETDPTVFERERNLLKKTIASTPDKLIVYFSSCALVDDTLKTKYYRHKQNMEKVIHTYSQNFLIIRLPQVIGLSKNQNTLINYLFDSIKNGKKFNLWDRAYRYVIDIADVRFIVNHLISESTYHNQTIDVANPYRYSISEIVEIIESFLQKKAVFEMVHHEDQYTLELNEIKKLSNSGIVGKDFGKNYLLEKLKREYA